MDVVASQWVPLHACADEPEAAVIRSLLEAHGIACVVRGGHHRAMLGALGSYIEVTVLVTAEDRARARALLDAEDMEAPPSSESPGALADGVCAVHGASATTTCTRCGVFLCEQCTRAAAGRCEDCQDRASETGEQRRARRRKLAAWFIILCMVMPTLVSLCVLTLRKLFQ
ncbi:DUF2007 domain-containing protein [Myxococcaceae bacterium JPH2]|nr:DUF2007 domain-containing protein [Myxococcaceae bacterium JPH2]